MTLARARRVAFARAVAHPAIRRVATDKDVRVAVRALVAVASALLLALGAPVMVLVVSPLVFGVPHLASEARLFLDRAAPSTGERTFVAGVAIVLAALGAASLAMPEALGLETTVGVGFVACALVRARLALAAVPVTLVALAAALSPDVAATTSALVVATHAFVSLGAWLSIFRPRGRRAYAIPAVVLLLAGVGPVLVARGPIVALAFLQSVHYALWLSVVPDDDTSVRGAPTAAMLVRATRRSLGPFGFALVVTASVAVLGGAIVVGFERMREVYLAVARFHLWIEIGVVIVLTRRR